MQLNLFSMTAKEALDCHAVLDSTHRGAVFTKQEVVEFILDMAGYSASKPLYEMRLLEPSSGEGDFLALAAHRLLIAYAATGNRHWHRDLKDCIRAIEVHEESIEAARMRLSSVFDVFDVPAEQQELLLDNWIHHGDFLLTEFEWQFTHVTGNPPYVRQERVPPALLREYRTRYKTIYDRADLYVPFIERGLQLLADEGALAFICPDRWIKNRYGTPLRDLIARNYHLEYYVELHEAQAFQNDVSSYPCIAVIRSGRPGRTRVPSRPVRSMKDLEMLAPRLSDADYNGDEVRTISCATQPGKPWTLFMSQDLELIQRLEESFPSLEEAGCNVGIGVATGADKVYIQAFDSLDVEESRKLPLVTTKDIRSGSLVWGGLGVINPYLDDGSLVNLVDFPRLSGYLKRHQAQLMRRNCAKRRPEGWYRTIDRIHAELRPKPKLLIPDIKNGARICIDPGEFYPHHNLYYIVSDEWDVRYLKLVLDTGVLDLFVSNYSTKMRGGYLRYQAQYLRRVHIPHWKDLSEDARNLCARATGPEALDDIAEAVFGLSGLEIDLLRAHRNRFGNGT